MAVCFHIAEEYRRLLAEFTGSLTTGLEPAGPPVRAADYDPLRPLPIGQITPSIDLLRRISSDVPVEWRFGEYLATNSIDLVTSRALGSRNIGEALAVAHRHQHIQTNVRSFAVRSAARGELTEIHHAADDDPDKKFVLHSLLAAKLSLLFRFYQGTGAQHHIARQAGSFGSLLRRFGAELDFLDIDFHDSEIALNLSCNVLSQDLPDMGERQKQCCDQELQRRNAELPCATQWADRIRGHIRSSNFAGITIDEICDAFCVQRRTLGRLLRDEGTTFTSILTELRREKALHLVRNTGVPLKRVAAELGFNSDASFNMAFKSWTGTTPMKFRKSASAKPAANDLELRPFAQQSPLAAQLQAIPVASPIPIARPLLATFRPSRLLGRA